MTKVHPGASVSRTTTNYDVITNDPSCGLLTVWKKSLLFNSDGFTVFDGKGNLVFRVDDYGSADIVLMDASGIPIYTLRRKKRLSLFENNWVVYEGETSTNPILSTKKKLHVMSMTTSTSCLAHVTFPNKGLMFEIEGSYANRCCVVYDNKRHPVAEIRPKEPTIGGVTVGLDVFRLVILDVATMDPSIGMALVILLDRMFDSSTTLPNWLPIFTFVGTRH